jgi:hypothetical protein
VRDEGEAALCVSILRLANNSLEPTSTAGENGDSNAQ